MWSTPNEGTSPCVAFRPTRPHCAAGILVLPPESAPIARSASPAATAAAEPPEEPPAEWDGRSGLRGGPKTLVTPKPEPEKSSRFVLPTIVPPASSTRSTTTASTSGVYESVREPFVIGMPATATESFTAIRPPGERPAVGAVDLADADEGVDRILVRRSAAGRARGRTAPAPPGREDPPPRREAAGARPRSPRRHPPRGRARSRRAPPRAAGRRPSAAAGGPCCADGASSPRHAATVLRERGRARGARAPAAA